jgi:hypothetical protein
VFVVSNDHGRAPSANGLQTRTRVGAVPHHIAQADEPVHSQLLGVGENGGQGLQVCVDISEKRVANQRTSAGIRE